MTRNELIAVISNPLSSEQQRGDAQALLDKLNSQTGFDASRAMLADWYRTFPEPQRHEAFEQARKETNEPEYSEIEEAKPAKEKWLKVFHRENHEQSTSSH